MTITPVVLECANMSTEEASEAFDLMVELGAKPNDYPKDYAGNNNGLNGSTYSPKNWNYFGMAFYGGGYVTYFEDPLAIFGKAQLVTLQELRQIVEEKTEQSTEAQAPSTTQNGLTASVSEKLFKILANPDVVDVSLDVDQFTFETPDGEVELSPDTPEKFEEAVDALYDLVCATEAVKRLNNETED